MRPEERESNETHADGGAGRLTGWANPSGSAGVKVGEDGICGAAAGVERALYDRGVTVIPAHIFTAAQADPAFRLAPARWSGWASAIRIVERCSQPSTVTPPFTQLAADSVEELGVGARRRCGDLDDDEGAAWRRVRRRNVAHHHDVGRRAPSLSVEDDGAIGDGRDVGRKVDGRDGARTWIGQPEQACRGRPFGRHDDGARSHHPRICEHDARARDGRDRRPEVDRAGR